MELFSELPIEARPLDLQRCCERELAYRQRVYPRLIVNGSMSERKAKTELELMAACVAHFRALAEVAA